MDDREFCKKIIKENGHCQASKIGTGPWKRACTKESCPIYQEIPCMTGRAVGMAKEWLAENQEVK